MRELRGKGPCYTANSKRIAEKSSTSSDFLFYSSNCSQRPDTHLFDLVALSFQQVNMGFFIFQDLFEEFAVPKSSNRRRLYGCIIRFDGIEFCPPIILICFSTSSPI